MQTATNRLKALFMLALTLLAFAAAAAASGCADDVQSANDLVSQGDAQRISASDKLRKSTASVDALVRSAAAGQALPAAQTRDTTDAAVQDLNSAIEDLASREAQLDQASRLSITDTQQRYIALLQQSNDKLKETVNAALAIPTLIAQEQYSLAGWDEIKAQQVVRQVQADQQRIDSLFNDSEQLRNSAEAMRTNNPGGFED